ncbi:MAG: hypothetical protein RR983_20930 [Massilia sp.]
MRRYSGIGIGIGIVSDLGATGYSPGHTFNLSLATPAQSFTSNFSQPFLGCALVRFLGHVASSKLM